MYTQCPECEVTFKVTAEVLQQARGRVRCGNCGEAFNALDHLSESPPLPQASTPQDPEAERKSQELLNTLNQLVGPEEVHIEDTGIEWRVMEKDADGGPAEPTEAPDENAVEPPADSEEELRYDDNTPLPDDFADEPADDGHLVYAEAPESFEFTEPAETDSANELDLSEPDEWTDLLEEVEIGDENSPEAMEARGETVPTEDSDAAEDAEAEAAEPAASEDIPAEAPVAEVTEDESEQEPSVESAVPYDSPPDDSADDAHSADAEDEFEFAADEDLEIEFDDEGDDVDEAAAAEIEEETSEEDDDEAFVAEEAASDEDLEAEDAEEAHAETADETGDIEDSDDDDELEWAAGEAADGDEAADTDADDLAAEGEAEDEESASDSSGEFERAITNAEDEDSDVEADVFDDPVAAADGDAEESDAQDEVEDDIAAMTANMQIDPDVIRAMQEGNFDGAMTNEDGSPMVETIIMEGDAVRDALDAADTGERRSLEEDDPASLLDTYISSRKPDETRAMPGILMIVVSVVLALALAGQFVHSQREMLATQGWFESAVAPIYASLGMPVTPDWDIKGWQFEATSGSTGGSNGDLLTISSRVSNRSSQSLPYPLVHVSLTDRYQEVIGSRILEPGEYLTNTVNDGAVVSAGGNFTATITIADTSAEATGFNLNVCYPEPGNRVRCAIEDFKER